jgi:hypothetical protein
VATTIFFSYPWTLVFTGRELSSRFYSEKVNSRKPQHMLCFPTLSGTILTPIGSAIGAGVFGVPSYGVSGPSPAINGVASIVALVGLALLAFVALYTFLRFEQSRQ